MEPTFRFEHMGHVNNNEAPPKSTYQWHLFGSGVFYTGLGIFSLAICLNDFGNDTIYDYVTSIFTDLFHEA